MPTRVIAYIDGFNLYFGLKERGWRQFYWLNIHQLMMNLLKPDQVLARTKYFTSRVSGSHHDLDKSHRQAIYLEALETLPEFRIYYGHYLQSSVLCPHCKRSWMAPEEKMTDVNIAVEMMTDAFQNQFDTAILVSGDSDLAAPLEAIKRLFPAKKVIVAFPAGRISNRLARLAYASFVIGRTKYAKSLFPDMVPKPGGFVLCRPINWR
ncbi:MAG: NYN domain-containing protein [Candidatus Brocadiia bacterium]|jgi:uncharacterized LabA/DUF88 family protein